MPNRYEREIEEILRNLESAEPKSGARQKFGDRLHRRPEYPGRPRRPILPSLHFKASDWFIVVAIITALAAGGYAYTAHSQNIITGGLALVSALCLLLTILSPFMVRSRSTARPRNSIRYEKVRPIRRNPLHSIATRWNLFLLKMRYRRKRDH